MIKKKSVTYINNLLIIHQYTLLTYFKYKNEKKYDKSELNSSSNCIGCKKEKK